jgi:cation diffusion facilitator family transporter
MNKNALLPRGSIDASASIGVAGAPASVALRAPSLAASAREQSEARRLVVVILLLSLFFGVELTGAIVARSDVLRADALHLLTDVAALGMALVAMRIAARKPTARFTFGLRRVEPVAAIINALLIFVGTALLVLDAIADLRNGGSPRADVMLWVALGALVVNGFSAWLIHGAIEAHGLPPAKSAKGEACEQHDHLHIAHEHIHHGHGHALSLRGAWLHLFGDALGSLAAVVAAVLIRFGVSPKADAFATFVVAAILIVAAFRLVRDAVSILFEAAPPHVAVERVRAVILATQGVAGLHDLHVWSLGAGHDAITAHVEASLADPRLATRIEHALRAEFRVEYVTIQVETAGAHCDGLQATGSGLQVRSGIP